MPHNPQGMFSTFLLKLLFGSVNIFVTPHTCLKTIPTPGYFPQKSHLCITPEISLASMCQVISWANSFPQIFVLLPLYVLTLTLLLIHLFLLLQYFLSIFGCSLLPVSFLSLLVPIIELAMCFFFFLLFSEPLNFNSSAIARKESKCS